MERNLIYAANACISAESVGNGLPFIERVMQELMRSSIDDFRARDARILRKDVPQAP